MLAARQRLRQGEGTGEDAGEAMDEAQRIEGLVKALACEAIMAWQGVVAAGEPVEPSPETIAAVLDRRRVDGRFGDGSFGPGRLLDAEESGGRPLEKWCRRSELNTRPHPYQGR